jgi:hypothetical protein
MIFFGEMFSHSLFQLKGIVALELNTILQSTEGHCTGTNRKTQGKGTSLKEDRKSLKYSLRGKALNKNARLK